MASPMQRIRCRGLAALALSASMAVATDIHVAVPRMMRRPKKPGAPSVLR